MSVYFAVVGAFALAGTFEPIVALALTSPTEYGKKFKLPLVGDVDATFTVSYLASLVGMSGVAYQYFQTKHFLLNNMMGMAFCVQGMERISLGTVKNGTILLCGLFFYDIFWVFGTDVMVTVAKSFDAPIKLLFVKAFAEGDKKAEMSLLGLGDIVIPGIFIAMLLRFDAANAKVPENAPPGTPFPKPYFTAALFMYTVGLLATVGVMYFFEAAQPALLYLVPACLLASVGFATVRGQFKTLWEFSEEEDEAEAADASKKDN